MLVYYKIDDKLIIYACSITMLTSCTKPLQNQCPIFSPLSENKNKSLAVHKCLAEVIPLYEVSRARMALLRLNPTNDALNTERTKPINETLGNEKCIYLWFQKRRFIYGMSYPT